MNCKTITKDIIHEKGNDYNMEIKDLISFNSCIVDKDNCSFDHYLLKWIVFTLYLLDTTLDLYRISQCYQGTRYHKYLPPLAFMNDFNGH